MKVLEAIVAPFLAIILPVFVKTEYIVAELMKILEDKSSTPKTLKKRLSPSFGCSLKPRNL